MLVHLRAIRLIGAFVASTFVQVALAATAAACSNGNGFPF